MSVEGGRGQARPTLDAMDLNERVVNAMRVMLFVVVLAVGLTFTSGPGTVVIVVFASLGIAFSVAILYLRWRKPD
jgi:hypothetical protein